MRTLLNVAETFSWMMRRTGHWTLKRYDVTADIRIILYCTMYIQWLMTTSFKVFENFQQQIAKKNYFYFCEVRSNLKLKKNFNWLKTWFFYFEKKAMFRIHDHDPYKKVKIWIQINKKWHESTTLLWSVHKLCYNHNCSQDPGISVPNVPLLVFTKPLYWFFIYFL